MHCSTKRLFVTALFTALLLGTLSLGNTAISHGYAPGDGDDDDDGYGYDDGGYPYGYGGWYTNDWYDGYGAFSNWYRWY